MTPTQFSTLAHRKIADWYSTKDHEDRAVERMTKVRSEIINILTSLKRPGIDSVLQYLDNSGFYYRASSPNKHHNFPGGLAEHSLGTYKLAAERNQGLMEENVIIAALLHDICKADRFWFKGRDIRQHTPKCKMDDKHSVRSIYLLESCGLNLTEDERLAIRWHMRGTKYIPRDIKERKDHFKAINNPLWALVFQADKDDAKAHPAANHSKYPKFQKRQEAIKKTAPVPESNYSIELRVCDVTSLDLDAVVNAANETLLGGRGIDGAIHRAAGPELLEECRTLHGCKVGQAKITKGYNLKAKNIIHTVGPRWYGGNNHESELLTQCYESCLDIVAERGLKSVGFCGISTGNFGFPAEPAAKIALSVIRRRLDAGLRCHIVIFSDQEKDMDVYRRLLK